MHHICWNSNVVPLINCQMDYHESEKDVRKGEIPKLSRSLAAVPKPQAITSTVNAVSF